MAIPEQSLCSSWATIADVCAPCNTYDFDPALLEGSLLTASEILYNLTGRKWAGRCTDVIRPCAEFSARIPVGAWQSWSGQQISATGAAAAWGVCGCHRDISCGCASISAIRLPLHPATGIVAVLIDGLVLDPAFYRLDNYGSLTYKPGIGDSRGGWPCCQAQEKDSTEVGTFEITYSYATPPPNAGVDMAAEFGCQIALARSANAACRLPQRVQSVVRQGVSMTFADPRAGQGEWTGLPLVDTWIASIRYAEKHRVGAVINPERLAAVRRNTP